MLLVFIYIKWPFFNASAKRIKVKGPVYYKNCAKQEVLDQCLLQHIDMGVDP